MKKISWIVAILLVLIPSISALAKGDFTYITVSGPGITGDLTISNPTLTQNFFAFGDFSKGAVDAPADPGEGYRIIRSYVVDSKEAPFDSLQYYPYTGYVYYNGLGEGSSEYDKKWFIADPAAKEPFLSALKQRALLTWLPLAVLVVILIVFIVAYRKKSNPA
ncbi:MAG TPA: hypothetical protein PKK96_03360 [Anaerolineales bacterium]|nr:hypothetical protein [Anaerolineales bacterium]HMS00627.1 hypothetical protein [Anaerolineales bacterium]HNQ93636.1 hypothetical protein [Anaerolineales bacterium]HNS60019.1 hypothetical protein [Anaerolineales bacterium]